MSNVIDIDVAVCRGCGLCGAVCPARIMKNGDQGHVLLQPEHFDLCIQCGQCMAICPTKAIVVDGLAYARDFFDLPSGSVQEMSFLEMMRTRRAIRNYKDQPVAKELLAQVVEAIAFAPPGFTPIKTEIVVVQDRSVMHQVLPEMIKVYDQLVKAMRNPVARLLIRQKVGAATFKTLTNHVVPLMDSRLLELKRGVEDTITHNAPAMIVFHAQRDAENYRADGYIALTYGLLAAHAVGLGACAIDLIPPAIENHRKLREWLVIPEGNVVVAAMVLGYAEYGYQRGIRRELRSVTWI